MMTSYETLNQFVQKNFWVDVESAFKSLDSDNVTRQQ